MERLHPEQEMWDDICGDCYQKAWDNGELTSEPPFEEHDDV
jgi:hypothetical protein